MSNFVDIVFRAKDQFSGTLKGLSTNLQQQSGKLRALGRDIEQSGYNTMKAGQALTKGVTAPIVALGAYAVKTGSEYEKSMSYVQSVTQATSKEMKQMDKAIETSLEGTTKSIKDGADALGYMGLAGWSVQDSIKGLPSVLKLAEAGGLDTGRASDLATDSMSAMGLQVEQLSGYLDVVAQTARSSNTDIDQMMEAYIGVGGVLKGLNVDYQDSAVYLGMLANAGVKGAEGGNALSAILTNLTAPTGRAKKALAELGYSAFDSEGNFKGLDTVMFDLKDKFKTMTPEQVNMYKAMIAGKEHVKDFNAILNGLDDSFDGLKESIGNSNGALDEMAETMTKNLRGEFAKLKQTFELVGKKIYVAIGPTLEKVIGKIRAFGDKIKEMPDEKIEKLVKVFVKLAAVGPLLMGVGKITKKIGDGILGVSKILSKAKKAESILKVLFSPGTKIVLILIAISLAIMVIYKNWDKITNFVKNSSLGEKFEELKKPLGEIKERFGELGGKLKELWKESEPIRKLIGEVLVKAFEFFVNVALQHMTFFVEEIRIAIDFLRDFFGGLIDFVTGVLAGDWETAFNGLKTMFWGIVDAMKDHWQALVDLLSAPVTAIIDVLSSTFHDKLDKAKQAWEGFKTFVSHPIQGTISLFRHGDLSGVDANAEGTSFFRGGLTKINERGGEIIDLPRGSRIYPHDESIRKARAEGNAGGNNNITIAKLADKIIVREESDIDKVATRTAEELLKRIRNTSPQPV